MNERKFKRVKKAARDFGFAARTEEVWRQVDDVREALTVRKRQKWNALEESVRAVLSKKDAGELLHELFRLRNKPLAQAPSFPTFVQTLCRVLAKIGE